MYDFILRFHLTSLMLIHLSALAVNLG